MTSPSIAKTAAVTFGTPAKAYVPPAGVIAAKGTSRYDKTDPYGGTFRAYLAQNWPDELVGKVVGVSIDATGKLVVGDGTSQGLTATKSGLVGVIVLTQAHKVNEGQVDVMRFGCITGFQPTNWDGVAGSASSAVPGTKYFVNAVSGVVDKTAGGVYVGSTIGADRLEVNVNLA
jgi:hypothetical protein